MQLFKSRSKKAYGLPFLLGNKHTGTTIDIISFNFHSVEISIRLRSASVQNSSYLSDDPFEEQKIELPHTHTIAATLCNFANIRTKRTRRTHSTGCFPFHLGGCIFLISKAWGCIFPNEGALLLLLHGPWPLAVLVCPSPSVIVGSQSVQGLFAGIIYSRTGSAG